METKQDFLIKRTLVLLSTFLLMLLLSGRFTVLAQTYLAGLPQTYKLETGQTMAPRQIAYDPVNDLFVIAVAGSNKIYTWNSATTTATHIAGSGTASFSDNANGLLATFNNPSGVTMLFDKNEIQIGYLIADSGNSCLRSYATGSTAVDQLCGVCGTSGSAIGNCNGAAHFMKPVGVDYHQQDEQTVIADVDGHAVLLMTFIGGSANRRTDVLCGVSGTPGTGDGSALSATFTEPFAVALFPRAQAIPTALFVSEHGGARLRRLVPVTTAGSVSTIFDHGTSNKGWGLDHRWNGGTSKGTLLWWNDFNGLVYVDITTAESTDAAATLAGLGVVEGVNCGENNIVWPATRTDWTIFGTRNSVSTVAGDTDVYVMGPTCPPTTTSATSSTSSSTSTTTTLPSTSSISPTMSSTTLPTTSAGSPLITFVDSVVALRPDCSAEKNKCAAEYEPIPGTCVCPPQTYAVNVSLLDNAFTPSSSSSTTCGEGEVVVGLCSTAESIGVSSASAFVQSSSSSSECLQPNPETSTCSCPPNRTLAFPLITPVIISNSSGRFTLDSASVTFCMPTGQGVFWTRPTSSSSLFGDDGTSMNRFDCVHPLGVNYTCTCRDGAKSVKIPSAIYNSSSQELLNSGTLTFCGSDLETLPPTPLPPLFPPGVVTTGVVSTVIGVVSGANIAVVQAAAIMSSVCSVPPPPPTPTNQNSTAPSSSPAAPPANPVVVFAELDAAGEAKGWLFMLLIAICIPALHLLIVTILAFVRYRLRTPIKLYNAPPEDRGGDVDDDESDFAEDRPRPGDPDMESFDLQRDTDDTNSQSFAAQWHAAALQLKFPHYSLYPANLVFAGFASESALLIAKGGGPQFPAANDVQVLFDVSEVKPLYLCLGVLGLMICISYIVFVHHICRRVTRQHLEADAVLQHKLGLERERRLEAVRAVEEAAKDSLCVSAAASSRGAGVNLTQNNNTYNASGQCFSVITPPPSVAATTYVDEHQRLSYDDSGCASAELMMMKSATFSGNAVHRAQLELPPASAATVLPSNNSYDSISTDDCESNPSTENHNTNSNLPLPLPSLTNIRPQGSIALGARGEMMSNNKPNNITSDDEEEDYDDGEEDAKRNSIVFGYVESASGDAARRPQTIHSNSRSIMRGSSSSFAHGQHEPSLPPDHHLFVGNNQQQPLRADFDDINWVSSTTSSVSKSLLTQKNVKKSRSLVEVQDKNSSTDNINNQNNNHILSGDTTGRFSKISSCEEEEEEEQKQELRRSQVSLISPPQFHLASPAVEVMDVSGGADNFTRQKERNNDDNDDNIIFQENNQPNHVASTAKAFKNNADHHRTTTSSSSQKVDSSSLSALGNTQCGPRIADAVEQENNTLVITNENHNAHENDNSINISINNNNNNINNNNHNNSNSHKLDKSHNHREVQERDHAKNDDEETCAYSDDGLIVNDRKHSNPGAVTATNAQPVQSTVMNQTPINSKANNNESTDQDNDQQQQPLPVIIDGMWPPPVYCHFTEEERAFFGGSDRFPKNMKRGAGKRRSYSNSKRRNVRDEERMSDADEEEMGERSTEHRYRSTTTEQGQQQQKKPECSLHSSPKPLSTSRRVLAWFMPQGMWAPDHCDHNRRFGALFFTYTAEGAAWAPAAVLIFLLIVAIVSSLSGCQVPLQILGVLHVVFAIAFLWKQPARVPLDNILVVLQYFFGAALAFSRGAESAESSAFFTCVLVFVMISIFHALVQFGLEECVLFPKKLRKFKTMKEVENGM